LYYKKEQGQNQNINCVVVIHRLNETKCNKSGIQGCQV